MEIIGVISALVGFLVAIPTISVALKHLYLRGCVLYVRLCHLRLEMGGFVTEAQMRSIPDSQDSQEQLITAIRALLDEKESLIEQYGCPPAMQRPFEEQERSVPHGLST